MLHAYHTLVPLFFPSPLQTFFFLTVSFETLHKYSIGDDVKSNDNVDNDDDDGDIASSHYHIVVIRTTLMNEYFYMNKK